MGAPTLADFSESSIAVVGASAAGRKPPARRCENCNVAPDLGMSDFKDWRSWSCKHCAVKMLDKYPDQCSTESLRSLDGVQNGMA